MGGGNRIRSACNTIAAANASFGNFCSIEQFRKYGSPRNFFGGADPRTSDDRLEENSLKVPVLSKENRGTGSSGEESSELAKLVLSCKCAISSKRNAPHGSIRLRADVAHPSAVVVSCARARDTEKCDRLKSVLRM